MNAFDVSAPAALGLISGLHCTQMCGAVVLSYSLAGRGGAAGHLCYNAGRMAAYALLGAAAGGAGHAVGLVGRVAGIEQTAAIVGGALMVMGGLAMCGGPARRLLFRVGLPPMVSRAAGTLMGSQSAASRLLLGALMGLLPCGVLWAALLQAAGTGSAAAGALAMGVFGAGTAVALLAIGVFSSSIRPMLGRWSAMLPAISVCVVGAMMIFRGVMAKAPGMSCHGGM